MKHSTQYPCLLLVTLLSVAIAGCSGQTLDGGSNASGSSSGDPSGSSGDPAGSSGTTSGAVGASAGPLEGNIAGKPFTPLSVELKYSKANAQWFLSLSNYAVDCGIVDMSKKIADADKLVITIGEIAPAAGTYPIAYADGHGATFQSGVHEGDGSKADTEPATKGSLRLDTWSETAGSSVTGYLELSNDESAVKGTFTAKVCEPR